MKYFKPKQIQNPQKLLSFQTTPKKLKTDRKFFPAPFSATSGHNLGPYVHRNLSAKRYFLLLLSGYFAELLATWKQLLAGQQLAIRGGQDPDLVLKAGWFPLHELF